MTILRSTTAHSLLCGFAVSVAVGCTEIQTPGPPDLVTRTQMHMGTLVTITAVGANADIAHKAVQVGFDEIKRLERLLSTWRADSELSRVNTEAGHRPVQVSREALEVVTRSLEMAELTSGGFNIALGPAIEIWRVTEGEHIPDQEELERLKPLVDWRNIQLNRERGTIYLPQRGMRIDIGGIGKGYAADRAAEEMKRTGATAGVVAISGDIKTFGVLPGRGGFPVGVRHPREEGTVIAVLDLHDEAISTAGDYERFFERDGIRYHHILDPQTLQPARGCQSVTVIAKEGIVADGLDTGIFVLGPKAGMELVERLPDIEAIIIDHEGKMIVSSGLRHRLREPR